jgi:hypothetical protein
MCKPVDILAFHESGYVVQCSACKILQFAFGTTVASLTEEQFDRFSMQLDEKRNAVNAYETCCCEKCIHLPVTDNCVMIGLTPFEADSLSRLLAEGKAGLEVKKLLRNA